MKTEVRYGARIKQIRKDRGWTQQHLAEVAGITVRTLQRVENDETESAETLSALAAAFNVTVGELARTYTIRERRAPRAMFIEAASDFAEAMRQSHDDFVVHRLAKTSDRVEEVLQSIFEDLPYISEDEPSLFNSYIRSLAEPLDKLRSLGFSLFSIHEKFDRILRLSLDEKPVNFPNWTRARFLIVPRDGCFHLGGEDSRERLHRFNAKCAEAIEVILKAIDDESEVGVYTNPALAFGFRSSSIEPDAWCDRCFPAGPDGNRLSLGYLATMCGKTEEEFRHMAGGFLEEDFPIIGHA